MAKISLDLSSIKSAGIYTIEIDESMRVDLNTISALRLLVGFAGKGAFNRPVFLQNETQRLKIYGDIDTKLEKKGCWFNRFARILLDNGPILALNLLKVDDAIDGPDQVNYAALSLDAGSKNPVVKSAGITYGEYDYLADTLDAELYGTEAGDSIPFVGKTPYSSLYDRGRFWIPSEYNLQQVAATGLGVNAASGFEKSNFLNFANCGTDEISILVYKAENLTGYDITAKDWYGGAGNIPYGWIRPSDFMSDYFIRVVAVKGNWSNYPVLAADPTWGKYFDKKGIKKDQIQAFAQADGVSFIGSWSGCIIPDFTDKQGNYWYIKDRVNAQSETTGLIMNINEDAMAVVTYDLNGIDVETGSELGRGAWIYDFDGNNEGDTSVGEGEIGNNGFVIDMVGHGFLNGLRGDLETNEATIKFPSIIFDGSTGTLGKDTSVYYIDTTQDDITGLQSTTVPVPVFSPGHTYQKTRIKDTAGVAMKLYGVYDDTNRRFSDDFGYVAMTENAFKQFKAKAKDSSSAASVLSDIMGMDAYNADGEKAGKTIGTIDPSLNVALLKNDILGDNGLYEDASVYYGNYAAFNKDTSCIHLFEVAAGGNNSKVYDIDILDTKDMDTTEFVIEGESGDTSVLVYPFSVNASKYGLGVEDKKFYMEEETGLPGVYGFAFMSYNYTNESSEEVLSNIRKCYYFNGKTNTSAKINENVVLTDTDLFNGNAPVNADCLNMFIITDEREAARITKNDLVQNITFYNNIGDATKYGLIPGVTRVINKVFVTLTASNEFTYKGKKFAFNSNVATPIQTKTGKRGFYLLTTVDPVLISSKNVLTRQLPISDNVISSSLRFIPLKGLSLSSRHRPGYDENGRIGINEGIRKIYSVLWEDGIRRSICSPNMVDSRYIIDSMSFGLDEEMGGKVYLSKIAQERGKMTAILNMPSKAQFEMSNDPIFCDTYEPGQTVKPPFNAKYVASGGNLDMPSTRLFTLPKEINGSKFTAVFFPNLLVRENGTGRTISMPPAAYVANTFIRKFQGGDPYAVVANMDGIIRDWGNGSGGQLMGVEYDVDTEDRNYLEPMGVNSIIRENNTGLIKVYANVTAFQDYKSDFNKLHVRENLNTLEIACDAALKEFNFKYNTPQVRAQVVSKLTPIFEAMKQSQALYAYKLTCDTSNNTEDIIDNDMLLVDAEVAMSRAMEKIVQRFTLRKRSDMSAE